MCGIIGLVGRSNVNQSIYDGLMVLQHRGQDAAGIMTSAGHKLFLRKASGLVRDVFQTSHMINLHGCCGIGHVRYPTAGCTSASEAQPFYVNSPYGIALAHNGNLTNAEQLNKELFQTDRRHINTESDSEVLLNVFAHELQKADAIRITEDDIFAAVAGVHQRCRGGYAAIAMISGYGVLGFRDPHGIRPMVYGRRETAAGPEFMIASESVALDVLGFERIGDVAPGEAVFISLDGQLHVRQCAQSARLSPCIFEYVYLARPDSVIDDIYVYKARLRMGEKLAEKIKRDFPDHDIDVVIPIPDTSRTAASALAAGLGVNYREGFIKNRYIGRTFIMPGQKLRKRSVRHKLNAIDIEFRGKNVMLVDDSIVRGTTSQQIVEMARESGAKNVYFASASPPVRYPNVYGIDMPTAEELIAHNRDNDEICREIGADWLLYQDLGDLIDAVRKGNPAVAEFDTSCFSGQYVTGDVGSEYLSELRHRRGSEREQEGASGSYIDVTGL